MWFRSVVKQIYLMVPGTYFTFSLIYDLRFRVSSFDFLLWRIVPSTKYFTIKVFASIGTYLNKYMYMLQFWKEEFRKCKLQKKNYI